MEERGMAGIHEVFDHLYPGIMTLGMAAMSDPASKYLGDRIVGLTDLPKITRDNFREIGKLALEKFGQTIEVDGPIHEVNPIQVELDYLAKVRDQ